MTCVKYRPPQVHAAGRRSPSLVSRLRLAPMLAHQVVGVEPPVEKSAGIAVVGPRCVSVRAMRFEQLGSLRQADSDCAHSLPGCWEQLPCLDDIRQRLGAPLDGQHCSDLVHASPSSSAACASVNSSWAAVVRKSLIAVYSKLVAHNGRAPGQGCVSRRISWPTLAPVAKKRTRSLSTNPESQTVRRMTISLRKAVLNVVKQC